MTNYDFLGAPAKKECTSWYKNGKKINLKTIYLCTIVENETLLLMIYTDNNRNASYAENWEGK